MNIRLYPSVLIDVSLGIGCALVFSPRLDENRYVLAVCAMIILVSAILANWLKRFGIG